MGELLSRALRGARWLRYLQYVAVDVVHTRLDASRRSGVLHGPAGVVTGLALYVLIDAHNGTGLPDAVVVVAVGVVVVVARLGYLLYGPRRWTDTVRQRAQLRLARAAAHVDAVVAGGHDVTAAHRAVRRTVRGQRRPQRRAVRCAAAAAQRRYHDAVVAAADHDLVRVARTGRWRCELLATHPRTDSAVYLDLRHLARSCVQQLDDLARVDATERTAGP